MMPYYDGSRTRFWSDTYQREYLFTEEEAEAWQLRHPDADLVSDTDLPVALPDGAGDDYLNCTCPPDLPDGRSGGKLCKACELYFDNLLEDM